MKRLLPILALLLSGCGTQISITYTPPITVGLTFDFRAIPVATTQPAK